MICSRPCNPGTDGDCGEGWVCRREASSGSDVHNICLPDAPEICDGLDNDSDGRTDQQDDDFEAAPPADRDRYGVCTGMTKQCLGAAGWQEPAYWNLAGYEDPERSCDGQDNDCDGQTDEELAAPAAAQAIGVCLGAVQVCAGQRGWQEPDPTGISGYEAAEVSCDGQDNDCDGATDEGLEPPADLACPATGVCAEVRPACTGQGGWVCPTPQSYEAPERSCDGWDNDCDGATDEELSPPADFVCPAQGVCEGSHPVCRGQAGWGCTDPVRTHEVGGETRCDGLDNDCDGLIDEELQPPPDLICQDRGVCQGTTPQCRGEAGWSCLYPEPYEQQETLCDGLDNDCDGATDEELPLGAACSPGLCEEAIWACGPDGQLVCTDDLQERTDLDGDRVIDRCDNCPAAANRDQVDEDHDHVGDSCDAAPGKLNLGVLAWRVRAAGLGIRTGGWVGHATLGDHGGEVLTGGRFRLKSWRLGR